MNTEEKTNMDTEMEALSEKLDANYNTNENGEAASASCIDVLPDEVLENLFLRLSPYQDLEAVGNVSTRWNRLAKDAIQGMKTEFRQSIISGRLQCLMHPGSYGLRHSRSHLVAWPQERFGQMACYYDKAMYIIGGSTHRKTTFNDMWKLDLGSRSWSRVISHGNYPSPKAFASCVQHKNHIYLFGGWTYTSSSPLVTPWRLFDELHRYNLTINMWTYILGTNNPPPMAGHSCSAFGDEMVIFGGRTYDQVNQQYPVSNDVWVFDFNAQDWYKVTIESKNNPNGIPAPRYGQTQVAIDESHIVIIGGCDGPKRVFSDIWLLTLRTNYENHTSGTWRQLLICNPESISRSPFHYSGCRVGDAVVFFQQISSISPYMTLLHFDGHQLPLVYQQMAFEDSRDISNQGSAGSEFGKDGWRLSTFPTSMPIYSLDISKVLIDYTVRWTTETAPKWTRPGERFLYAAVTGRSEIIMFGGFYKEPNGRKYRVSNDVFILRTVPKTY